MRDLRKGDVVRLVENARTQTDRGVVRQIGAGHQFEVVSHTDGVVKVRDGHGCRYLLPAGAVKFVRAAHSPDDDGPTHDGDSTGGGPVGAARTRMPRRKGLVQMKEAA